MYKLNKRRGPWQVHAEVREKSSVRPLVIILDPIGCFVKQKGRRKGYRIEWTQVWIAAAQLSALEIRKAKREAKKKGKGAK